MSIFTAQELSRYQRHLILPGFGAAAQAQLKNAKILVVGAGGLGCPALLYLAAAGVGTIGIVDFDRVEDSNLQRQVLFTTQDIGRHKAIVAKERLEALNPYIQITAYTEKINSQNALELLAPYAVVLDGTDNFPTRYLLNDACVFTGKTYLYGAISKFEGHVSVFNYLDPTGERGPNYRDLYPTPPPTGLVPSCTDGGVLGVLPGLIGTMQATEAIKVITGIGQPLAGRLWLLDALSMESNSIKIKKRMDNPVSGVHPVISELIDYEAYCNIPSSAGTQKEISPTEMKAWLESGRPFQLIDVREYEEYTTRHLNGTLIPLGALQTRTAEISRDLPIVVHCHSGRRSTQAIQMLKAAGFENLYNLTGGIEAFLQEYDVKS